MKIAVIGSGISGLSCSWLLSNKVFKNNNKYEVTLFEKNNYLGGHSNTATINYNNKKIAVDTGFIVFNHRTYPNLKAFFELLKVKTQESNMSFGIKDLDSKLEYSGNSLSGLFAQKSNLFKPKFLKMLKDILTFNKKANYLVKNKIIGKNLTLIEFIDELKLGDYFKDYYLFPMAAAIWSCPLELMKNYPAKTFLQFFYNHGLLTILEQPQWHTVQGGSKEYVKKIKDSFLGEIKLNLGIKRSKEKNGKIILTDDKDKEYEFDKVIFASHADQTYNIISDKTDLEKEILSKIKYSKNLAILHKNEEQMPKSKKAWASWVYLSSKKQSKVALSYYMNKLQNIDSNYPLFVTLNPIQKIPKKDTFLEVNYEHPIFDLKAVEAQENLQKIQGKRNIYFAGAWNKYGFHEDGLLSAVNIVKSLGIKIPW